MFRTLTLLSKRVTIPRLAPAHTRARIVCFEVSSDAEVAAYDPVMVLECSSDLVPEAYRETPDQKLRMAIDTQEEGIIKDLNDHGGEWLECGTVIGWIDDGDEMDGDWMWQANLDGGGET